MITMSEAAGRLPSFDELYREIEALPEGLTGEILEPGVLRTMSRPGRAHRRAAKWCLESLRGHDRTLGGTGWWIEAEAEIRLPEERLVVPDLAGWRVERVPVLPEDNPIAIVPDWCCEVLSPRTARDDRVVKLPLYCRSGVQWVWLVDPTLHTVEVFENVDGRATLSCTARESDVVALPPFDSQLDLTPWWTDAPES